MISEIIIGIIRTRTGMRCRNLTNCKRPRLALYSEFWIFDGKQWMPYSFPKHYCPLCHADPKSLHHDCIDEKISDIFGEGNYTKLLEESSKRGRQ